MSVITYKQNRREYTEGIGSLFQRELLSYLVSIFLKISFKRSKLFFYDRHNRIYYSKKSTNYLIFLEINWTKVH